MRSSVLVAVLAGLAGSGCAQSDGDAITLTVSSREGNRSSPLLYGAMFEVRGYVIYVHVSWLTGADMIDWCCRKWITPVHNMPNQRTSLVHG